MFVSNAAGSFGRLPGERLDDHKIEGQLLMQEPQAELLFQSGVPHHGPELSRLAPGGTVTATVAENCGSEVSERQLSPKKCVHPGSLEAPCPTHSVGFECRMILNRVRECGKDLRQAEPVNSCCRDKIPAVEKLAFSGVYEIRAQWDGVAGVWVAESDDVPGLVAEADSPEVLVHKLKALIPELLELNGAVRDRTARFHVLYRHEDSGVLTF